MDRINDDLLRAWCISNRGTRVRVIKLWSNQGLVNKKI